MQVSESERNEHVGGMRSSLPPRHKTKAPEEPTPTRVQLPRLAKTKDTDFRYSLTTIPYTLGSCAPGLIFFPNCEIFGPHVIKRVLAYFPLPFRLLSGLFLFWVLLVKPSLYVDLLISMSMFRLLGRGPQVGPFPSRPILGSIREEGTPQQTLAII